MKVTYNAPVVLTFSLACVVVLIVSLLTRGWLIQTLFMVYPTMDIANPLDYLRLVSYVLGHQDFGHLIGNLTFLLLLGPSLEEKYGSLNLGIMMALTALVTGLATVIMFPNPLLGASGIVFMMILLASFTNVKAGELPLTFILIAVLFLGKEILAGMRANGISEAAHLLGGICGAFFGSALALRKPAETDGNLPPSHGQSNPL